MSRISSEPASPEPVPPASESATRRVAATSQRLREQRERRRFERSFWLLVVVLLVVCAVFLLLGSLQGPKLSSAVVDPVRVTEQSGQQLRLFANQPLGAVEAEQVTVTPAAPVAVAVQNELLIVQFEQRLRYDTEYTVEVRDVAASGRAATATFTHRFTTGSGSLLYLDRGEQHDEILRAGISEAGRGELVHAAEGIQHFVPVESVVVVARDAPGGASVLESVPIGGGSPERIPLPEGTRVESLVAPPSGTVLGLVLSSVPLGEEQPGIPGFADTLAVVDLAGDRMLRVILGLDGEPVRAQAAEYLPDGVTMIVHGLDESVLRVEVSGSGPVLPVDQLPTVWGLSTEGRRLSGADSFGGLHLDLETGEETRLNPSLFEGELAFGGEARLTAGELWVQKVAVPDASGGSFRTLLVADEGLGASRLLFRTVEDRGSIGDFRISPNDQFVAVEITPSVVDAVPDGRLVNGRPTSITTVIVDLGTGVVVRTLQGFAAVW